MVIPLSALVKIPQILGAALAGNVFVLLASKLADLSTPTIYGIFAIPFIFFLNLKDFFDDMKSYETQNFEGFSLFPTVFFRVISYMCLAWAASLIARESQSFLAISTYFMVFIIWSIISIFRRYRLNSDSTENLERLRRRKGWLVLYPISAILSFLTTFNFSIVVSIAFFVTLIAIYVFDVIECRSFHTSTSEIL